MAGHWKAASATASGASCVGAAGLSAACPAAASDAGSGPGAGSAQAASDTADRAAIRVRVRCFMACSEAGGGSEAQVPHRLAVAADQAQRLDADLDVVFNVLRADHGVAGLGLHPFRDHR